METRAKKESGQTSPPLRLPSIPPDTETKEGKEVLNSPHIFKKVQEKAKMTPSTQRKDTEDKKKTLRNL